MNIFGKSESGLTRDARRLSDLLLALDEIGRLRCSTTIAHIMRGIQSLGTMPPDVVDVLWSMLCTIARRAIMGGDADVLMKEIRAGLAPEIQELFAPGVP